MSLNPISNASAHPYITYARSELEEAVKCCTTYEGVKEFFSSNSQKRLTRHELELLIAFIQINDIEGKLILEQAVENHDYTTIDFLINLGININTQGADGKTCLFYTTDKELFKYFVARDADVSIKNHIGQTPLFHINSCLEREERQSIMEYLLDKCPQKVFLSIDDTLSTIYTNTFDARLWEKAITLGLFSNTNRNYAIAICAFFRSRCERDGLNWFAIAYYTKRIVGQTRVQTACASYARQIERNDDATIDFLIQLSGGINTQDTDGETCLFYTSDQTLFKHLVARGADISIKNHRGFTPVCHIISHLEKQEEACLSFMEYLLDESCQQVFLSTSRRMYAEGFNTALWKKAITLGLFSSTKNQKSEIALKAFFLDRKSRDGFDLNELIISYKEFIDNPIFFEIANIIYTRNASDAIAQLKFLSNYWVPDEIASKLPVDDQKSVLKILCWRLFYQNLVLAETNYVTSALLHQVYQDDLEAMQPMLEYLSSCLSASDFNRRVRGTKLIHDETIVWMSKIKNYLSSLNPTTRCHDLFAISSEMPKQEHVRVWVEATKREHSQLDCNGHNILEAHCYAMMHCLSTSSGTSMLCLHWLTVYTECGLSLSKTFLTTYNFLCEVKSPFIQTLIFVLLSMSHAPAQDYLIQQLSQKEHSSLVDALSNHETYRVQLLHVLNSSILEKPTAHANCRNSIENTAIYTGCESQVMDNLSQPPASEAADAIAERLQDTRFSADKITDFLRLLTPQQTRELLYYYFTHPQKMLSLSKKYFVEKLLAIQRGGIFQHTYAAFVFPLLDKLGTTHIEKNEDLNKSYKAKVAPKPIQTLRIEGQIRELGRSLLVSKSLETTIAYKFMRREDFDGENESYAAFSKELAVTEAYRRKQHLFMTPVAIPKKVWLVGQVEVAVPQLNRFSIKNAVVYKYKAGPKKFIYLNDEKMSDTDARLARQRCITGSTIQILHGIYPDGAALFHNTQKNRTYLPLIDLCRVQIAPEETMGAGRLDAYKPKITFPNMREDGPMVDLVDACLFAEVSKEPSRFLGPDFFLEEEASIPAVVQGHALAKLGFTVTLLVCDRRDKSDNLLEEEELAKELQEIWEGILHTYTGEEMTVCHAFAENCGVNWTLMSKQCSFWLNHGERGYRSWVKDNKLPKGLYDPSMELSIAIAGDESFHPNLGFSSDGIHNDIGIYNGPLPLTELQKAFYIFPTWALAIAEYRKLKKQSS